ncbi:MAG: CDP-diacylglycerol--glycerol-3-phosphate 3-phosphatidyltransferase [Oscillospiraceae bacterium]|nr:CDP-diacylglycerol--glycerol-3-phosphate 3-phosphatidyltransferase [Oscillospiraceae bacterium]
MNLPNKLTVLRVCLIPIFLFLFFPGPSALLPGFFRDYHYFWALAVFSLASFTDYLDGRIARRRGLITDFGKLMDPLADKVLVMAAMVGLVGTGMVHPITGIVILAREFLVSAIRQLAASGGHILAADNWGKMKTVAQMLWIAVLLLISQMRLTGGPLSPAVMEITAAALTVIALLLTVYSGINYTWKNRGLFADM